SIELIAVSTPPQSNKSRISIEEVAKLKGNVDVGKQTIMRCVMCHEINGVGPNFGPRLEGWAKKQSKSATIKAILYPSQGIAHGFRGEEYLLKDGRIIQGITEVRGDPSIVLSQGGISQMIPKSRVKSSKGLKQSLMLSADQLALTAQDVADIVAFMKQWQ
ncbi:MAG: c-type cytochrome, partial [Opitutales bacterium]